MSVMFPHRRSSTFLIGLILVDLPVLLGVAVVGAFIGYAHTYEAITEWRLEHPWTLIPSAGLVVVLVGRWWRS